VKKFKRLINTRIIKQKQSYSTQEIADLLKVGIPTINRWYATGLKPIDNQRPCLVFAADLIDFLNKKNRQHKIKTNMNELFCCKCKLPHKSLENAVTITIINPAKMMIVGTCEKCGSKMNKLGSSLKIEEYKKTFTIQTVVHENLLECANTSVIDSKREA